MKSPRIFLAIDNCFASKRWTEPKEWMRIIKDLGIFYAEASADNECDPLYMTKGYMEKWKREVKEHGNKTGIEICNLYSGHGTYSTLGLAHTNKEVSDHILNDWLKKMIENAVELDAGLGFFCHAFNQSILQDKEAYRMAYIDLIDHLAILSDYAGKMKIKSIGVEQMYTPHQIPWTIDGAKKLIKDIYERTNHPFYITIDTGHQSGQRKFLRPDMDQVRSSLEKKETYPPFWLGTDRAYGLFEKAKTSYSESREDVLKELMLEIEDNPHMFAVYDDGDPYNWLSELGCYSPIIHLQQTDGFHSKHWPFTEDFNKKGIIQAEKVLEYTAKAYQHPDVKGMPPKCDKIFLTIEVFSGTSDIPYELLKRLESTVDYWRKMIPVDGKKLDELIKT
jgi:sugar phosphate isomerase/epimerase